MSADYNLPWRTQREQHAGEHLIYDNSNNCVANVKAFVLAERIVAAVNLTSHIEHLPSDSTLLSLLDDEQLLNELEVRRQKKEYERMKRREARESRKNELLDELATLVDSDSKACFKTEKLSEMLIFLRQVEVKE